MMNFTAVREKLDRLKDEIAKLGGLGTVTAPIHQIAHDISMEVHAALQNAENRFRAIEERLGIAQPAVSTERSASPAGTIDNPAETGGASLRGSASEKVERP